MRHRIGYRLSERVGWSRGTYRETAAGELPASSPRQAARIAELQSRYHVRFEALLGAATSVRSYEYLDILDQAWSRAGLARREVGVLCDVGCASFWYAAALAAFFGPRRLLGVEIEGHRLLRDGRARIDHARGYVAALANAEFVVADYSRYAQPADLISAWFPFLTPNAILAWRLPLDLLRPQRLFERIHHNLTPGGLFLMVNHGPAEAEQAHGLCEAVGLNSIWRGAVISPLSASERLEPPWVSFWQRSIAD